MLQKIRSQLASSYFFHDFFENLKDITENRYVKRNKTHHESSFSVEAGFPELEEGSPYRSINITLSLNQKHITTEICYIFFQTFFISQATLSKNDLFLHVRIKIHAEECPPPCPDEQLASVRNGMPGKKQIFFTEWHWL